MKSPASSFPADEARTSQRSVWPWLLAGGPVIVVVASVFTASLAVRSDDGLVAQDYYKRGLMINQKLRTLPAETAPRLGARLAVSDSGNVRVHVRGVDETSAAAPATLRLRLSQATLGTPVTLIVLQRESGGDYVGKLGSQAPGRWIVGLESDAWRLPTTTVVGRLVDVRLGVAATPESS